MSLRTISRTAIGGYVKMLRLPLDAAIGLRERTGANGVSEGIIVLDRFEARLRSIAGWTLRDDELVRDAERRRLAADKRERAVRLRTEAQTRSQRADARLSDRVEKAEQLRRQAARRAEDRKKRAERKREGESRRIAGVESRRRRANENVTARKAKAIQDRSKHVRLQQLNEKADTLAKKQDALTARNEAQHLRQAASKTKATRKRGRA